MALALREYPFPCVNTTKLTIKETVDAIKELITDKQNVFDEKTFIK